MDDAPVVEPSPVCGARVDYHGGTCGRPVGHDSNCAPVIEPEAACEGCPDPGLPCAGCPIVEPERMPCGHTHAAIVSSGEGTSYCGECVEACSPDDYETGPEPTCAAAYQHGRADERDGYSGEHSPSAVEAGNDGERATHATGSDAVGLSPSSRCACGATITGTRCDASGMTAAVCQKVPLLDSTTNPVEPGCDGHCAPDECVCPGLAKLAVLAERARIVAIIEDTWGEILLRDLLAAIEGGPTDA